MTKTKFIVDKEANNPRTVHYKMKRGNSEAEVTYDYYPNSGRYEVVTRHNGKRGSRQLLQELQVAVKMRRGERITVDQIGGIGEILTGFPGL